MKTIALLIVASLCACCSNEGDGSQNGYVDDGQQMEISEAETAWKDLKMKDGKVVLSDEEWRKRLTPAQYKVCREAGTEARHRGYWDCKKDGTYLCSACGNELFESNTKFESGTGWPSFWQPVKEGAVAKHVDKSLPYETRTEVKCSRCDSHLGHVFDDGPDPTGMRYCINSVSLLLRESKPEEQK